MASCLVGLGSNQGDRSKILDAAVVRLGACPQIEVVACSAWHETSPIGGPPGQARFLNGAALLETSLTPHELLARLLQIEDRLGRCRAERWGPRTIDLDLLLYDELVLKSSSLEVPHPRLAYRRFVLEPAAEVAGAMLHPTIHWSISRLLEHLGATMPYVAITGPIAAGKSHLAERLVAELAGRLIAERPNWARLDAFYTNPSGHGWKTELEFLDQRGRLLAADAAVWSEQQWAISDFWFDQSAAFAKAWLPDEQYQAFLEPYERLRQTVARPRLVVQLDVPVEELLIRIRQRGRDCERHLTTEPLERIRQAVVDRVGRPDSGPVLHVGSGDHETVLAEALAAVRGME